MDMRLVLVTHPSKEHAERITRGVIDAKLAACVLVTDVKSFYNWEGKLNEDDEVVTILKTSTDKVGMLEKYRWIILGGFIELGWVVSKNFMPFIKFMNGF